MELLTDALRQKIAQLVAIDKARQAAIPTTGLSYFSKDEKQVWARQEFGRHAQTIADVLDGLTDAELTFVAALAMYGTPHGSLDGNTKFADALAEAGEFVSKSARDQVISNLAPKQFSAYLLAGLKRAQLD
ncbi:hypothetical protein [Ralstonia wenshanensis]|uniref:Uncharacterized protein n=1 Tax=Ralstonia wenshanensis TaxID=2842456 RepID=A0AAD2B743_9RALS|nr:hypothetical protein [Ralstonia wenshanensis]CAJ0701026.1 hypothetical protein LMG18091_03332 [Ralstonia wenshanensis]